MNKLLITILISLTSLTTFGQDREIAEKSVIDYMSKNKDFKFVSFGECFEQNYPEALQKKMKTSKKVKYSLVLTYFMNDVKVEAEYFQLDSKYKVIGHLPFSEMMKLTIDLFENNEDFQKQIDTISE